jgi:NADPH:quinone reductase-like Zn-dependent oxidoreductase
MTRQLRAVLLSVVIRQRLRMLMARDRHEDLLTLRGLLAYGQLQSMVSRTFALPEAADAVWYVRQGHASGKVVVTV